MGKMARVSHSKPNMGATRWEKMPGLPSTEKLKKRRRVLRRNESTWIEAIAKEKEHG